MTDTSDAIPRIDLAREPDFQLGDLHVMPSACRARWRTDPERRLEPRVMQVLVLLAQHANQTISRDQLIETCWPGLHVSDDAVARVVAQVRALARGLDPEPYAIETVTKVGFRLIMGEPSPPTASPDGRPPRRRWPLLTSLAVIAFVAAAGVSTFYLGPELWRTGAGRVELEAFESPPGDPSLARLAAATQERLVQELGNRGVPATLRSPPAGGPFGKVELRVVGALDRDGQQLAATIQIFDRRRSERLWSERFEAPPGALASTIAIRVAATLQCALEPGRPPDNVAFNLYLNACAAWVGGKPVTMLAHARRLVAAAPRNANAQAMHGIAAGLMAQVTDHATEASTALLNEARRASERAVQLNPRLAEAYVARELSLGPDGNLADRERDIRRALELDPASISANSRHAMLMRDAGRLKAAAELMAANQLPASPTVAVFYAATNNQWQSERELQRLRAEAPQAYALARYTIAFWWDDPATAIPVIRSLGQQAASATGRACAERAQAELVQRRASGARGLPPECDGMMADWRARLLARQGDLDGAYAILGQPLPNSRGRTHYLFYPEMKALRADARFMPLADRLGLVDYWLKTNNWPDFCAEPNRPYDCRAAALALRQRAARQPST